MQTENLLSERARTHGSFDENATTAQAIKMVARNSHNWATLSDAQRESIDLIATKLGRILSGNPNIQDHWDDIAGYAKLIAQAIDPEAVP